jgi:hypothetical protein
MSDVLRAEIRASSLRWSMLAIIAADVLAVLTMHTSGVWIWSDVDSGLGAAGTLAAPIATGVAAFEAQRRFGNGMRRRARSSVRPASAVVVHAVVTLAWVAVAVLSVALGFVAVYAAVRASGTFDPWWAVAGGAGIIAAAAIGYAAGALVRSRLIAPLAAVAVYLGSVLVSSLQFSGWYWTSQLYPATLRESSAFDTTISRTFQGQTIWYLGVALVLLAAVVVIVNGRVVSAAFAIVAIAALFAGATIVHGTNGQAVRSDPGSAGPRTCERSTNGVEVCVLAAYASALPELTARFGKLYGITQGTGLEFPGRLEHLPRGIGGDPPAGSAALHLDALGPNSIGQDSVAAAIVEFVQSEIVCRDNRDYQDTPDGGIWMLPVTALLGADGRLGPALVVGDTARPQQALDTLLAMTDDQLRDWLDAHADAIHECMLGASDYVAPAG